MIDGTRSPRSRRLFGAGALLAAGIAGWDVATRGSALVALVMTATAATLGASAVLPIPGRTMRVDAGSSDWFSTVASRTGFSSTRSLAVRSVLELAGVTLVQRFVLWPSAALGFDLFVSVAGLAIMLLLAHYMVSARDQR